MVHSTEVFFSGVSYHLLQSSVVSFVSVLTNQNKQTTVESAPCICLPARAARVIDLAGSIALKGVSFVARDGEMPVGEVVLAWWRVRFALLFPSALTQLAATHNGPGEHKYGDAQ